MWSGPSPTKRARPASRQALAKRIDLPSTPPASRPKLKERSFSSLERPATPDDMRPRGIGSTYGVQDPAKALPPIINPYDTFRAATYQTDERYRTPTDRIGSNYSPGLQVWTGEEVTRKRSPSRRDGGRFPIGSLASSPLPPKSAASPMRSVPSTPATNRFVTTIFERLQPPRLSDLQGFATSSSLSIYDQRGSSRAASPLLRPGTAPSPQSATSSQRVGVTMTATSPQMRSYSPRTMSWTAALEKEDLLEDEAQTQEEFEEAIAKYYHYIEKGISGRHVTPMKEEWIRNILALVPEVFGALAPDAIRLAKLDMCKEARDEYYLAIKKAIVDYVLSSPVERRRLAMEPLESFLLENDNDERLLYAQSTIHEELGVGVLELHETLLENRYDLSTHLFVTVPHMQALQELWYKHGMHELSMCYTPAPHERPMELKAFLQKQETTVERVRTAIYKQWLPAVVDLFHQSIQRSKQNGAESKTGAQTTKPHARDKSEKDHEGSMMSSLMLNHHFLNAVTTLIGVQLRDLLQTSLEQFVNVFENSSSPLSAGDAARWQENAGESLESGDFSDEDLYEILDAAPKVAPLLTLKMTTNGDDVDFTPSFQDVEVAVLQIYDEMISCVSQVPRVEDALSEITKGTAKRKGGKVKVRHVSVASQADSSITEGKYKVVGALRRQMTIPARLLAQFETHRDLFATSADDTVASLFPDPRSTEASQFDKTLDLSDIGDRVSVFQREANAVAATSPDTVSTPMFFIRCAELKSFLQSKANEHAGFILDRIISDAMIKVEDICKRYDDIAALTEWKCKDLDSLVALRDKVLQAEQEVIGLAHEVAAVRERLSFVEQYNHLMEDRDFRHAWVAYLWPLKVVPIMEQVKWMLRDEERKFEGTVRTQVASFCEDLETAMVEINTFDKYSDLSVPGKRYEDAKDLLARIERFSQMADKLHEQEATVGLPATNFGQIHSMRAALDPHLQLWEIVSRFEKDRTQWRSSPLSILNAEEIAEELDEMRRNLSRISRAFVGKEEPTQCALLAKKRVETFEEDLPLMKVLCNPGLRQRHWEVIFDIIGFRMRPDTTTTLKEALNFNLAPYMEQLAKVSESASKEFALERSLERMQNDWENVELLFAKHKDESMHVLSSTCVDDIQAIMDDQIVKTQAMLASPFVQSLGERVHRWAHTLQTLQRILDEWLKCQSAWLYLEPVFSSEDIQRQMREEGQRFAAVDRTWRRIVGETVKDTHVITLAQREAELNPPEDHADNRPAARMAGDSVLQRLLECNRSLEQIQKGLSSYLERKRLAFPRFFFLSNDELLDILAQSKNPERVQPHLRKCFEGIHTLEFKSQREERKLKEEKRAKRKGRGGASASQLSMLEEIDDDEDLSIVKMCSVEGEKVDLKYPVFPHAAHGAVERWLLEVEAVMFASLRKMIACAVDDYTSTTREERKQQGMLEPASEENDKPSATREGWTLAWPGQAVLAAAAAHWTAEVHEAIKQGGGKALSSYAQRCTSQLKGIVNLVRGSLKENSRKTISALIVMDVHARDVVASLADKGVDHEDDFDWQCQLRYYCEERQDPEQAEKGLNVMQSQVVVRMINASLDYGYEYLGNSSRLVITPLTDRCYRTLIGALHLNLGGAPEGPAGTGKTETTKDLAKAIAIQCIVFNCSDALDHRAMGTFFKGLASSGAWACFDEFNRIEVEVLSVVAQQLLKIQRAIARRLTTFIFEDTEISLNTFITMNPGYAGRAELPDNLKALFRTVAMMVPDYAMIAEIMLYSFGYLSARDLARKIVATYKLCSEQLSSQDHYDYGMRAVMAVLRAAGNLKQKETARLSDSAAKGDCLPETPESSLVLRSIIDVNLCKFLSHDIPLFQGILSDLFPDVNPSSDSVAGLREAIRQATEEKGLQMTDYFEEKVLQLYEMVLVRHGLMVVGLPHGGKTSTYQVLARALNILHEQGSGAKTDYQVINPKSIDSGQLYGRVDKASLEWRDGALAIAFRQMSVAPSDERRWLVLDGPVDAIWIENMNTVLDDNKKLCLISGEIIQMSPGMSMMFEVMDLAAASPATVSRCGMVYFEPEAIGWMPMVQSWFSTLPTVLREDGDFVKLLRTLFIAVVSPTLYYVRHECKQPSVCPDASLVQSLLRLFRVLANQYVENLFGGSANDRDSEGAEEDGQATLTADMKADLQAIFQFSVVWSVGASIAGEDRKKFNTFFRSLLEGVFPTEYKEVLLQAMPKEDEGISVEDTVDPLSVFPLLSSMPTASDDPACVSVFDFMFDIEAKKWVPWSVLTKGFEIPPGAKFHEVIVPTLDTARTTWMLDLFVRNRVPCVFIGPTGTGKSTMLAKHLKDKLPRSEYIPILLAFSGQTQAAQAQAQVDARIDRRKRGVYGPSGNRISPVFVDDLNMPTPEVFGAQPPLELLRQFLDQGGWFDTETAGMPWKHLVDLTLVGAMGPPGGGRHDIPLRLGRHLCTVNIPAATNEVLTHIFSVILDAFLVQQHFPKEVQALRKSVIDATLEVFSVAKEKLRPTPTKMHYTFNLRDFARVIQGMLLQSKEGLMQGVAESSATHSEGQEAAQQHIRLWIHEVLRVFYDRLNDDEDSKWFLEFMREVTVKHFRLSFDALFAHLDDDQSGTIDADELRKCLFGDFMPAMTRDGRQLGGHRLYREIKDVEAATKTIEVQLADYNSASKKPMPLVLFLFAVEHVSRICRVLVQPGGHALLVGVGGSGRQSLTRLAAYMTDTDLFTIEIANNYGIAEWKDDLKKCLALAGGGTRCAFLVSDTQLKDESFLEDISNLLNSGEVPNLFPNDEKATVAEAALEAAKAKGDEGAQALLAQRGTQGSMITTADLFAAFVERCRLNLHVVLCLSPIGNAFRERLRRFPPLINCCTIDWFREWPEDALEAVAEKFVKEMGMSSSLGVIEEQYHGPLVSLCKHFHNSAIHLSHRYLEEAGRYNYVTPTSYLELLRSFKGLLIMKKKYISTMKDRYENGLQKLAFAASQVADMQAELEALRPQLIEKAEETEKLMADVEHERKTVVEPKAAAVAAEEKAAMEKAEAARLIKEECEEDLGRAIPILEGALEALKTLKPADISLVKSMKNPPEGVKLVLESVCVMMNVSAKRIPDPSGSGKMIYDYWTAAKLMLSDMNFLDRLQNYDKDHISPDVTRKIRENYLTNDDFTPEKVKSASSAAEGLCKWVRAMEQYDRVIKMVRPKQEALAVAEAEYEVVMAGLREKQKELRAVELKLAEMQSLLSTSMAEKDELNHKTEQCSIKLDRAQKLIGGLGGEKERWASSAADLAKEMEAVVAVVMLAAGTVAYLGSFSAPFRARAMLDWEEAVNAAKLSTAEGPKKFSLAASFGNPVVLRQWTIDGLPSDSFSIDNAVIVDHSHRWPLMIDPQGQANRWVKSMHKRLSLSQKDGDDEGNIEVGEGSLSSLVPGGRSPLVTLKLTDINLMRHLGNAVQFGASVLIENVGEELDAALEPLLLRQTFVQGGVPCIRLGDATIDYSDDFRLFFTTKFRNPHYLPETAVKVALLNFTVTDEGLSDQLLGVVVAKERPDLEEKKAQLIIQSAENKAHLKHIEDKILHVLSTSKSNILEDETAVSILTQSKIVSNELMKKQEDAERTEAAIDETRQKYKPVANRASLLFFCVADLGCVEPMYQWSLQWFLRLFNRSIVESREDGPVAEASAEGEEVAEDEKLTKRLNGLNEYFAYMLYRNVCTTLMEKDKLLFSFLLAGRMLLKTKDITKREWEFLLTDSDGVNDKGDDSSDNKPSWLPSKNWRALGRLAKTSAPFAPTLLSITQNEKEWKAVYDSAAPQKLLSTLPGEIGDSLRSSAFRRSLLIRCFRPDKVVAAARDVVSGVLGSEFIDPPPFDIEVVFRESNATTPMVFILSPGSDPTDSLLKFAELKGYGQKIDTVSLGKGQGPIAERCMKEAARKGTWVVLQNCHLAVSWMPTLERLIEDFVSSASAEVSGAVVVNPNFRVFMTSYPSEKFPVSILQNSIKATSEPPKGLRANLHRSFMTYPINNDDFFCGCNKPKQWKALLYSLCFFHAVCQERRSFGPLGWNTPYEFNESDLSISVQQLQMFLNQAGDADSLPLKALTYLTGECNYGGRVTDSLDRRTLHAILSCYYNEDVVNVPNYSLSSSGQYKIPPAEADFGAILEHIKSLPPLSRPEAFGMHENADISRELNEAKQLLDTTLITEASGSAGALASGAGAVEADEDENDFHSKEQQIAKICAEILRQLPDNFDIEAVARKYPVSYLESMNIVLVQELIRYNKLLSAIRVSVENVRAGVQGMVVMSSELEEAADSIFIGKVPSRWMKYSYPTLKPLASYTKDFLSRLQFLQSWVDRGAPMSFWLPGFFFTQAFLTAVMQNYSRKRKVPIDLLTFESHFLTKEESKRKVEDGSIIHGLYFDGAKWNEERGQLDDPDPKDLFNECPSIHLLPTETADMKTYPHYDCPLYRTAERRGVLSTTGHSTNFVMDIRVPSDRPQKFWILRGVALMTQLSE